MAQLAKMRFIYMFIILSVPHLIKCELPIKINVESDNEGTILVTALFSKINWMMIEMDKMTTNINNISERIDQQKEFNTKSLNKLLQNQNSLVILRRQDGSENFDRDWSDYKNGFGDPNGEFFIGLESLHAITTYRERQELLIVLKDFENNTRYAKYDHFVVGNETEKYKILKLGNYSGDAGDALVRHLNSPFTTKDQDNDNSDTNCAIDWEGGWWFFKCYDSHLTGPYYHEPRSHEYKGIIWYKFLGRKYSLKFSEMILRPKS